ncbi:MAG TPA: hypothetical protein VMS17_20770 [Gemmataceae bacterium]|nr:hypothetical protein [Gemmataceae bacterium]
MPHNHEWQARIKDVEREYWAIRQATDRFQEQVRRDPTILEGDLRYKDIIHAAENLDGTYIIRLFAEFETGLRQYWDQMRGTNPRTRDLLVSLAAICRIPDEQHDRVHEVREYRNTLVHEREGEVDPIPVGKSRGYLCHFFSFLPPQW